MLFKRIHYKSGQIGQSAGLFFSLSNASFLPASSLSRRFISRSHLFVRAWRGSDESERDRAAFSCMRPFSVFLILLRTLYRARKKCFCTWLGELYYYFCVTVLPCSCWVLLSHVLQTFISGSLYRQSCFFVLFFLPPSDEKKTNIVLYDKECIDSLAILDTCSKLCPTMGILLARQKMLLIHYFPFPSSCV